MILFSSEKDEESEESEATAGQHGELWCFKKKKKKTDQWEWIMKRICSFFKMNDNMHLKYQLHLEPTDAAPVVDCGLWI